ncbi:MAG TPA: hypothetical protein VFU31_21030 [Candidatus Binatia bacterium]|nr:hypothetical protein [Candidatus Binatia bacterium]
MPPGGFPFEQKKADGAVHKFDGLTYGFNDQCKRIRDYRIGNNLMPTDLYAIGEELDAFTCERLGFDPRWCESKKNTSGWQTLKQSASHIVRSARHAAVGSKIIIDWLGSGGQPVAQELAQARADVCLQCPKNQEGHFVAKLTAFVAKAIHDQRREKLRMGLRVNGEDRIHTCSVCSCHLPLKLFVPYDVIAARTLESEWKEFPDFCWVLKEGGRSNETPRETSDPTRDPAHHSGGGIPTEMRDIPSADPSPQTESGTIREDQVDVTDETKTQPVPAIEPRTV